MCIWLSHVKFCSLFKVFNSFHLVSPHPSGFVLSLYNKNIDILDKTDILYRMFLSEQIFAYLLCLRVFFPFRCHEHRAVLSAPGHVEAGGHHERTEATVWCSCPRWSSLCGRRQRWTQDPQHCGMLQSTQQVLECHASHVHTQARFRLAPVS